jgi:hypothetical protein
MILKGITDLNISAKTRKVLEENIVPPLHDFGLITGFLYMRLKVQTIK